jgi:hypothetical protein
VSCTVACTARLGVAGSTDTVATMGGPDGESQPAIRSEMDVAVHARWFRIALRRICGFCRFCWVGATEVLHLSADGWQRSLV